MLAEIREETDYRLLGGAVLSVASTGKQDEWIGYARELFIASLCSYDPNGLGIAEQFFDALGPRQRLKYAQTRLRMGPAGLPGQASGKRILASAIGLTPVGVRLEQRDVPWQRCGHAINGRKDAPWLTSSSIGRKSRGAASSCAWRWKMRGQLISM